MPLVIALLALALAPGNSGDPVPTPEVRRQVEALLGSIHGPVSPEVIRALGPGAEVVLEEVARSNALPSRRIRALEELAALGGARAVQVHRDVAASGTAPSAVRRGAVRGLGKIANGPDAASALVPFLEKDRDPAVRATAAEALVQATQAEGCERVRAQARVESDAGRFTRALSRCGRAAEGTPTNR